MVSLILFVLVASAVGILAQPQKGPQPNAPKVKIVRIYHGKDQIKQIIARSPHIPYQLIGRPDAEFPKSQFGKPGQLKVLAVLSGKEAIARFVYDTGVKPTLPQVIPPAAGSQSSPRGLESQGQALGRYNDKISVEQHPHFQPNLPRIVIMKLKNEIKMWNDGLGSPPVFPPPDYRS